MIFPLATHEVLKSYHETKATNIPGATYSTIPGSDILAPCDGKIMLAHWSGSQGRCVNICGDDWWSIVSIRNIQALFALECERVRAGQVIATTAGPVTIIVWHGWRAIDPETKWEGL